MAPLSDSTLAGYPVMSCGFVEGGHDVEGLGHPPGHRRHAQPGVVVDDVQDLDLGAGGQPHVGHVHLPALVGQLGAEADVGALRALVGLGGDEAPGLEYPPDRGDGGNDSPAQPGEVHPDRLSPGVIAGLDQLLAHTDDVVLEAVRDLGR